jgi:hypothetical protein
MASKKHNKKRNTAFLYEALIRELTKVSLENQKDRRKKIVSLLKEFFRKGTILSRELGLYNSVLSSGNAFATREQAIQTINDVKVQRKDLRDESVYSSQSRLINQINKNLGSSIYHSFVPNYRNLATMAQIFNKNTSTKTRVILEQQLIDELTQEKEPTELLPSDALTYKTFVRKFNEKYAVSGLLQEQKSLLGKYVMAFANDGVDYKLYLNEEIERLKTTLTAALQKKEIATDEEMTTKTKMVLEKLDKYREMRIEETPVAEVLDIQQLVEEINGDDTE